LATRINIENKRFQKKLDANEISKAVTSMAQQISNDIKDKNPLFVVVLNGSFMFAADLIRRFDFPLDLTFIKVKSYIGLQSTSVTWELKSDRSFKNRLVIVLEDIVDTGSTIKSVHSEIMNAGALECKVATLFFKPQVYRETIKISYAGIILPSAFVVGYGLDYNGKGRNLPALYELE